MQVSPWHSRAEPHGPHHNNNKCTEGNNIETYNRVSGSGGKPLCKHCGTLNAQGR